MTFVEFSTSPPVVAVGSIYLTTPVKDTVIYLKNSTSGVLSFDNIYVKNAPDAYLNYTISPTSGVIAANDSVPIYITYIIKDDVNFQVPSNFDDTIAIVNSICGEIVVRFMGNLVGNDITLQPILINFSKQTRCADVSIEEP